MKVLIVFLLSCASGFGTDTSIQISTLAKTNAVSGTVFEMEVFTRDGQTNLVRTTTSIGGQSRGPLQQFYHDGVLVGKCWDFQDSSGFITEAGSPYSVIVKYWPSKRTSQAFICTKDRVVLDYFTATNGLFYPADSSEVREASKMTEKMNELMSPPQE